MFTTAGPGPPHEALADPALFLAASPSNHTNTASATAERPRRGPGLRCTDPLSAAGARTDPRPRRGVSCSGPPGRPRVSWTRDSPEGGRGPFLIRWVPHSRRPRSRGAGAGRSGGRGLGGALAGWHFGGAAQGPPPWGRLHVPLKGSDSVPLARQGPCPHAGPAASPSPAAPGECGVCLPLCSWPQRPTSGSQKASRRDLIKPDLRNFRRGLGAASDRRRSHSCPQPRRLLLISAWPAPPRPNPGGHGTSPDFLPASPRHTHGNEQIPGSFPDDEREGLRSTGQAGPGVILLLTPTSSPPAKSRGSVSRMHPKGNHVLSPSPHVCVTFPASGPGAQFPRSALPSALTREPDAHAAGRLSQCSPSPRARGPRSTSGPGWTDGETTAAACMWGSTTQPGTGTEL